MQSNLCLFSLCLYMDHQLVSMLTFFLGHLVLAISSTFKEDVSYTFPSLYLYSWALLEYLYSLVYLKLALYAAPQFNLKQAVLAPVSLRPTLL